MSDNAVHFILTDLEILGSFMENFQKKRRDKATGKGICNYLEIVHRKSLIEGNLENNHLL